MFTFMSAYLRVLYEHTFHLTVSVCMCQYGHNNIWKFPQDILCSFQNSSTSDNKMSKSSIMYRVSGFTWTNGFHINVWCLLIERLVCSYMYYVFNLLLELLPTWITCRLNRYLMRRMDLMNGRLWINVWINDSLSGWRIHTSYISHNSNFHPT